MDPAALHVVVSRSQRPNNLLLLRRHPFRHQAQHPHFPLQHPPPLPQHQPPIIRVSSTVQCHQTLRLAPQTSGGTLQPEVGQSMALVECTAKPRSIYLAAMWSLIWTQQRQLLQLIPIFIRQARTRAAVIVTYKITRVRSAWKWISSKPMATVRWQQLGIHGQIRMGGVMKVGAQVTSHCQGLLSMSRPLLARMVK